MYDDEELRKLLQCYTVSGPKPELEARTRQLMREELMPCFIPETTTEGKWIFLLTGMAVTLSMSVFYIFTVETILWYFIPSYLTDFLRHALIALTAAGGCFLTCAVIIFVLKQIVEHRIVNRTDTIGLQASVNGNT